MADGLREMYMVVCRLVAHYAGGRYALTKADAAALLCRAEGILEAAGADPDCVVNKEVDVKTAPLKPEGVYCPRCACLHFGSGSCALCGGPITSPSHAALAEEIAGLKEQASKAKMVLREAQDALVGLVAAAAIVETTAKRDENECLSRRMGWSNLKARAEQGQHVIGRCIGVLRDMP